MNNQTDEDVRAIFANSKAELKVAVEYAIQISNGLHGTETTDLVDELIYDLFSRSISAGLTLELLVRPPRWTAYKGMPTDFSIWDYSSLCMITRGLLETYLTLFYFCEAVSREQREFRKLWWDWHHAHKLLIISGKGGVDRSKMTPTETREVSLRQGILSHPAFLKLEAKRKALFMAKKEINDALLEDKRTIAIRAGIHESQYDYLYRNLSQHAHIHPLALSSLGVIKAATDDDIHHLDQVTQYATLFLICSASAILDAFPSGRKFVENRFAFMEQVAKGVLRKDMHDR